MENTHELKNCLDRSIALVGATLDRRGSENLEVALKNLNKAKRLVVPTIEETREIVERNEQLERLVEKLNTNKYTSHLPAHLQTLRWEMALETFFKNIETLGVEELEKIGNLETTSP
ncbi:hypothetical protein [Flagellimonas nanhaiensis]|uniref:Uncharacterized protein n=1 Tax=Flagellimonas nanhaiensis TaxID=2292706 RepID=A0A371JMW1_9FLAO|nr:hypothetical protein [Allomuricauda nanhaiensis]RDY58476.1 hypothetical protein DX873_15865 [Allomuricauda nanhaiensis]